MDPTQPSSHQSWHVVSEQSIDESSKNPLYESETENVLQSLDSFATAEFSLPNIDECMDRGSNGSLPYSGTSSALPEVSRISLTKDDSDLEINLPPEDHPEKLSTNVKSMWNNFRNGNSHFWYKEIVIVKV